MCRTPFVHLVLFSAVIVAHASLEAGSASDCLTNSLEKSLYCRGSRALRNVMHNLSKSDKPLVIMRGLEIVPTQDRGNSANASVDSEPADDSFLGSFSQYLRTHELNIKFSDLLADESERYLARDLEWNGVQMGTIAGASEEARKKDKGQGILLALALMSAKLLAVLGLGGIGALAMKALGVAMIALMMASIVGLKSLSHQGHESSHSVSYVTADGHHRRRRSAATSAPPGVGGTAATLADDFNPHALVYGAWQADAKRA